MVRYLPPDDDDILDIDFDDASDDDENVLDITLDDEEPSEATDLRPQPPESESDRYCPNCGFALPPLTDECPRCARGEPAAEPLTGDTPAREYPLTETLRHRKRPIGLIIAGIVVVVALIALPIVLVNSPTFKARAAYQDALSAQLDGDLRTARQKYRDALEYNPGMGLAAFGLGTTYLGITLGTENTTRRFTMLLEDATAGNTTALDQADAWFDRAIRLANRMPDDRKLMDENLSTPPKLASYAHAFKGLTALIRYYAAIQAEDFVVAEQWLTRAGDEAGEALALDPQNPFAGQIRGQLGL